MGRLTTRPASAGRSASPHRSEVAGAACPAKRRTRSTRGYLGTGPDLDMAIAPSSGIGLKRASPAGGPDATLVPQHAGSETEIHRQGRPRAGRLLRPLVSIPRQSRPLPAAPGLTTCELPQKTQRFVHRLGVFEDRRNLRLENDDIASLGIPLGVLPTDVAREVVLGP